MSIERYKLWVARSRQTDEEFDRDIPGKLFMFYDGLLNIIPKHINGKKLDA